MKRRSRQSSWIKSLLLMFCLLLMACLTGCGENSSDGPATTPTAAAKMALLVSNSQLNSDGATTVALTANVKDGGNRALKDQDVVFSADTGVLVVTSATTDANGNATATLGTPDDPTNRTITVTAVTGNISATNTVNVTGTTISISGLQSLSFGHSTDLTIFLKNSAGMGIVGKTLSVTSANGNTLTAASYVTNASGQITVRVTATAGGADTITASAIGATKTYSLNVSSAILTINSPTPSQQVNINTWQPVTATYTNAGVPVVGATVNFTTTRGTLDASSAVTNAAGTATVNVRSTNSGPAELAASTTSGPSTQVTIEFIATIISSMILQASPATIGTNSGGQDAEKSLITAVVRDANNNLVTNQTVSFTIDSDVSGGRLSPASAITDSSGTANAYFFAGGATTPLNGVRIRATVGALSATTQLTVAKKALFISLATGPDILTPNPNTYQKNYVALVTDAAGNPVQNIMVVPTITPVHYKKGYYRWGGIVWSPVETLAVASSTLPSVPACANEDGMTHNLLYDFNGILDPGEDQNGNDRLDPGNVASVTATPTDSTGRSTVSVVYARDYAYWVTVKLEASASTGGSTASAVAIFSLPGAAEHYSNEDISPPGNPSPFGISTTCFVDMTVTPVSTSQMSLTWQKSLTAASYNIYRNGVYLRNVLLNTAEDTGLASSTRYCYEIRTLDALGVERAFTKAPVCATTAASATAAPQAPTILSATPGTGPQVSLSWTASAGAALYNVYCNGGLKMSTTATAVADTAVEGLTSYCYVVTAVSGSGNESTKSDSRCTATGPAPATPILTLTPGLGLINLMWNRPVGAATYRIYRDGGTVPHIETSAWQATDAGLAAETRYCYIITAVDALGNASVPSAPQCATTLKP